MEKKTEQNGPTVNTLVNAISNYASSDAKFDGVDVRDLRIVIDITLPTGETLSVPVSRSGLAETTEGEKVVFLTPAI